MLVDSHCHLNYKGLVEEQGEVLARARARGVTAILNISTRASEWDAVTAVAEKEADVWCSIGVHPHNVDDHRDISTDALVDRLAHPKAIGIGETGLDYFYDHGDRAEQIASFRRHIHAAQQTGLPIIVHTRDAEDDTLDVLRLEMERAPFGGVIHCFTASASFGAQALELGLYISLSGIVTFRNATALQAIARDLPGDRLLMETDAPFLAPVPHRGKTCEPGHVADTLNHVAQLRGVDPAELAAQTSANFYRLFSKARP